MMLNNYILIIFTLHILVYNCINSASLSATDEKKYQDLINGQGLYKSDDDVEIFTAYNFKEKLYGKKNAWLINFYNSWCGFCQRFVPAWKGIATDIKPWKDIVNIGAIDCSEEANSNICREFEILGYPSLRYFHENYLQGEKKIGADIKKGENVNSIRKILLEQMLKEQSEGRGKNWPKILPYNYVDTSKVFSSLGSDVKYGFIVVDDGTNVSVEVILDLHKVPNITVQAISKENTNFVKEFNIQSFPKLIIINRNELRAEVVDGDNRESIITIIKNYLKPRGVSITSSDKSGIFQGKWIENPVPDIAALLEAREKEALRQKVKQMGDVVFQIDLENALRYSLKHEIGNQRIIEGEKLEALKLYLDVIVKYFPLGKKGKNFLEDLITEINSRGSVVYGEEIRNFLLPMMDNEDEGIFSSPAQWLGCSGSNHQFRGYPCGLWKMFHYLTVNSVDPNPRKVLQAMLGYVTHFFGCQDCSQHFQEMARENNLQGVDELNSSIIWLWLAHNQVNKRLAGDATEDPDYPKIQFPSSENCPKCRNGQEWNLTEVLHYLRRMYSNINVRYIGSDTKVLHEGLSSPRSKRSTSWTIVNRIDFSICFILYVICFGLLVIIVRLFLRRGYKKKLYVHDLLGKV